MRQGLLKASAVVVGSSMLFVGCSTDGSDQAEVSTRAPAGVESLENSQAGEIAPAQMLGDVAANTCENLTTGHMAAELELSELSGFGISGGSGSLTMTSDFDMSTGLVGVTIDASGVSDLLAPLAADAGDEMSDDIVGALKEPVEIVVSDNSVYVNWPLVTELAQADTPWVQISAPEEMADQMEGMIGPMEGMNPLGGIDNCDFMAMLGAVGGEMTEAGVEQLDGVDTTHYSGVVDLTKSLDQVPAEMKEDVEESIGRFGDAMQIPLEIWVDADGIARRIVVDYDLSGLEMGITGSVTLTVDLTGLGDPVTVTVPAADQVTVLDLGSLFGFGGANGIPGIPNGLPGMPSHD